VTQFCIEEAAFITLDGFQNRQLDDGEGQADEPAVKPGEITDPVMQDAMAKAKQIHAQAFGSQG
jgi:hypothetical protein